MIVRFHVAGRARTKGSLKVITPRGRKPILVEDHAHSEPWRKKIRQAIAAQYAGVMFSDAVRVEADFAFERIGPSAQLLPWPTVNAGVNAHGDIDKLVRNMLDAMQDVKLITDDCMVIHLNVTKRWAFAGESPGIYVEVMEA
jgi:Holliday junction resolvase RusA-like endonuclease